MCRYGLLVYLVGVLGCSGWKPNSEPNSEVVEAASYKVAPMMVLPDDIWIPAGLRGLRVHPTGEYATAASDWKIKIDSVSQTRDGLICVKFSETNVGNAPVNVCVPMIARTTEDGCILYSHSETKSELNTTDKINPGASRSGAVYYEVSAKDHLVIEFMPKSNSTSNPIVVFECPIGKPAWITPPTSD